MLAYNNKCLVVLPDIPIYMNCDTPLAINLHMFDITDNDELIFTIKNYNYVDAPYIFIFRTRKSCADENGEIFFKVPFEDAKKLKFGAFYNFSVLANAYDAKKETIYKKISNNGKIMLEYGAQDLTIDPEYDTNDLTSEIVSMRIEHITQEV